MIKSKKISDGSSNLVYDISADGTFVNALGMNILHNTDGFNFQMPQFRDFRYTKEHPYIGKGWSRETKEGKEYTLFEADVAEFNDMYMGDHYFTDSECIKMGLGIDEILGGYNEDGSIEHGSCIQFSRKNYADHFPTKPFPDDVKMVGNTVKSKKMPEYISKFLSNAIRMLLRGDGQSFINYYYDYVDKIYNYKIPLADIASKGKIKKSIEEYKKDVSVITKAGRPKSRQAWYELAIKHNLIVDNGDTVYYVNTGKSKSHSDVKKITHYYIINESNEKVEITKEIDSKYKKYKQSFESNIGRDMTPVDKKRWMDIEYPGNFYEEEILFNCIPVPQNIIESEEDVYCNEENSIEYNTAKYIDMFNKRITPLLVCFSREIRDKILIDNPNDRKFFTEEQCKLSSGEPNKPTDQDTYEQLMTMEDKEIKFWMKYDLTPPFIEECGMGTWESIKEDYLNRMKIEQEKGINMERASYEQALAKLTRDELNDFIDEGIIPESLLKIIDVDPLTNNFVSKIDGDIVIGTINDIVDRAYEEIPNEMEEEETYA